MWQIAAALVCVNARLQNRQLTTLTVTSAVNLAIEKLDFNGMDLKTECNLLL